MNEWPFDWGSRMRDGDGGGGRWRVCVCTCDRRGDAERHVRKRRRFSPVGTGPNNGGGTWAGWVFIGVLRPGQSLRCTPRCTRGWPGGGVEPYSFPAMHSKHAFSVCTLPRQHTYSTSNKANCSSSDLMAPISAGGGQLVTHTDKGELGSRSGF